MSDGADSADFVDASADALCPKCDKLVTNADISSLSCDSCHTWFHGACTELKKRQLEVIHQLKNCVKWFCSTCGLPSSTSPAPSSSSPAAVPDPTLGATMASLVKKVDLIQKDVLSMKSSYNRAARANATVPVPLCGGPASATPPGSAAPRTMLSQNSRSYAANAQELAFRRNNLIIVGIPEPNHDLPIHDRVQADRVVVLDICHSLNVPADANAKVHRMGSVPTTGVPRLTRVEFSDASVRSALLKAKSKLKDSTYPRVYIHPDLTKDQRIAHKKRLVDLTERRRNGEQVALLGKKIVPCNQTNTVPAPPPTPLITSANLASALGNLIAPIPSPVQT